MISYVQKNNLPLLSLKNKLNSSILTTCLNPTRTRDRQTDAPYSPKISLNRLVVCWAKSFSSELTLERKSREEEEVMVGERAPELLALLGLRAPTLPMPTLLSSPYPMLGVLPRKLPPLVPTMLLPGMWSDGEVRNVCGNTNSCSTHTFIY